MYPKALTIAGSASKNVNNQIGTPNGHYAPPAQGPFQCINCIHFNHVEGTPLGGCDHPEVYKDAEAGHLKIIKVNNKEMAEVHHEGCSDWYNPGPLKATSLAHL